MRIQLKKMLSMLLALIFCFALVSATALADEPEEETHEYTVETVDELYAAVAEINANNYTATVTLTSDVTLLNSGSFAITFSAGKTTIVGGGHTIFMAPYRGIYVTNSAVVNLCLPDGTDSLILSNGDITNNLTNPIVYMDKNAEMNMYDGAVVCQSKSEGTPGGFQLSGNSVLNMYGGVIRDLFSGPIAGGVMLSNFAAFNMYGGVIENCINRAAGNVYWWPNDYAGGGGAVVISDSGKMTMNGGVIRNCRSEQTSGGAVFIMNPAAIGGSADTAKPSFIMNGGTITGCSAAQIAGAVGAFYYGAAEIYIGAEAVITGNRAGYFGGGVAIYDSPYEGTGGVLTIADGASIYNNVSDTAGDDVMLWRGTLHLGSVGTGLILEADGRTIDGWYDDGNNDGEDGNPIRYSADNIIPIGTGDYTSAIVMKAAHGPYAPMTVKKTFSGISASQIPGTFEMTVTSPGVAEPAATLKTTDEGVAVSEDGLTFTWTLEVPAGSYAVSEDRAKMQRTLPEHDVVACGFGHVIIDACAIGYGKYAACALVRVIIHCYAAAEVSRSIPGNNGVSADVYLGLTVIERSYGSRDLRGGAARYRPAVHDEARFCGIDRSAYRRRIHYEDGAAARLFAAAVADNAAIHVHLSAVRDDNGAAAARGIS